MARAKAPIRFTMLLTQFTGLLWVPSENGATTGPDTWVRRTPFWKARVSRPWPGQLSLSTSTKLLSEWTRGNIWQELLHNGRDWSEQLAPVIRSVLVDDHNMWARMVAQAFEALRSESLVVLFGQDFLQERSSVPEHVLRNLPKTANREDFEASMLPPGYEIDVALGNIRTRWGGVRAPEPWSQLGGPSEIRRMAWEEFYCRLPSFTTGL